MTQRVVVIIGAGGMGRAVARRVGAGAHVLIADHDGEALDAVAGRLEAEGHQVTASRVDVSSRESVGALASLAASLGAVTSVVHTAGLSPVQAPVRAILAVDLLGTALVLEEFARAVEPGGAGVVIASMAGHFHPALSPQDARVLATAPADELLALPICDPDRFADSGGAYAFAKHANQLRVRGAAAAWGAAGARINSISPGVISTPMGRAELDSEHGATMRTLIGSSSARRVGTAADIAEAAAFLLGPTASYVCGTDLLVDGGVVAAVTTGALG